MATWFSEGARNLTVFGGALALGVAIVGCGQAVSRSRGPARPTGSMASRKVSPPHSRPSAAPRAVNGRDYRACSTGSCEVLITGPVSIRLTGQGGLTLLRITGIGGQKLHLTASGPGGGSQGAIGIGCTQTFYSGGGGLSCSTGTQASLTPDTGTLQLRLESMVGEAAVVRMTAGKPGQPPASLVPSLPTPTLPEPPN